MVHLESKITFFNIFMICGAISGLIGGMLGGFSVWQTSRLTEDLQVQQATRQALTLKINDLSDKLAAQQRHLVPNTLGVNNGHPTNQRQPSPDALDAPVGTAAPLTNDARYIIAGLIQLTQAQATQGQTSAALQTLYIAQQTLLTLSIAWTTPAVKLALSQALEHDRAVLKQRLSLEKTTLPIIDKALATLQQALHLMAYEMPLSSLAQVKNPVLPHAATQALPNNSLDPEPTLLGNRLKSLVQIRRVPTSLDQLPLLRPFISEQASLQVAVARQMLANPVLDQMGDYRQPLADVINILAPLPDVRAQQLTRITQQLLRVSIPALEPLKTPALLPTLTQPVPSSLTNIPFKVPQAYVKAKTNHQALPDSHAADKSHMPRVRQPLITPQMVTPAPQSLDPLSTAYERVS